MEARNIEIKLTTDNERAIKEAQLMREFKAAIRAIPRDLPSDERDKMIACAIREYAAKAEQD